MVLLIPIVCNQWIFSVYFSCASDAVISSFFALGISINTSMSHELLCIFLRFWQCWNRNRWMPILHFISFLRRCSICIHMSRTRSANIAFNISIAICHFCNSCRVSKMGNCAIYKKLIFWVPSRFLILYSFCFGIRLYWFCG